MSIANAISFQVVPSDWKSSWKIGCYGSIGCAILLILNLADGLFTLAYLLTGVAEELNPLMRWAYECSPFVFMSLKITVVNVGVVLLYAFRFLAMTRTALGFGISVYAGIVVYHLTMLVQLLSSAH